MPSNNYGACKLHDHYPGRVGWLFGLRGWKTPKDFPYALDNGRYPTWTKGKEWEQGEWEKLCDSARKRGREFNNWPLWVAVPDVVTDARATFDEWHTWSPMLAEFTLALVVQDEMTPQYVREECSPLPSVIFIGGTRQWKFRTLWEWCQSFPRVHVGRINTQRDLWKCEDAGAESCDGTGWYMGGPRRLRPLVEYLNRSTAGVGPVQRSLFISNTYTNANLTVEDAQKGFKNETLLPILTQPSGR